MYREIEIKWNNMVFFCSLNLRVLVGLIFFLYAAFTELSMVVESVLYPNANWSIFKGKIGS